MDPAALSFGSVARLTLRDGPVGFMAKALLKKQCGHHPLRPAGPSVPATLVAAPDADWPLPLILAVWAVAALVWPLTGSVVPWDSKNQFYPDPALSRRGARHGELPLWNPYHFGGHPSAADPQSLLFTPTMLLFGWLVPEPSMQAVRRRGVRPFPARRAGLRVPVPPAGLASGGRGGGGHRLHARRLGDGPAPAYGHDLQLRLLPARLLLLEEALDRRSYRFGVLFALVAAMMVIGRDQVAFLCALTLIAARRAPHLDRAAAARLSHVARSACCCHGR